MVAKGTIKIPNFSQENDIEDDLDLTSTRFDKDEVYDDDALKFAKVKGHPEIRKALKVNLIFKTVIIYSSPFLTGINTDPKSCTS